MSVLRFGRSVLLQCHVGPCVRALTVFGRKKSYESAVGLKTLYPESKLTLSTPTQVPEKESQKFSGYIPLDKLEFTYVRSSGPGGQHVNTNNTKVDMRFHVETAEWLHPEIREKILDLNKNQINAAGYLIIRSEKTRSNQLNKADCMERLRRLIHTAEEPPPPGPTPEQLLAIQQRKDRYDRRRIEEKRRKALNRKISLGLL